MHANVSSYGCSTLLELKKMNSGIFFLPLGYFFKHKDTPLQQRASKHFEPVGSFHALLRQQREHSLLNAVLGK